MTLLSELQRIHSRARSNVLPSKTLEFNMLNIRLIFMRVMRRAQSDHPDGTRA